MVTLLCSVFLTPISVIAENVSDSTVNSKIENSSNKSGDQQETDVVSKSVGDSVEKNTRKLAPIDVNQVTLTDSEGNPLTNVTQYTDLMVNIDFSVPNNQVNSGDHAVITLPDELKLEKNITFNIYDESGAVIAVATADSDSNTVELVFTDYVESHSDISGKLQFVSKVTSEVIEEEKTVPIYIDINGESIFAGDIEPGFAGDDEDEKFSKYSWFDNEEGTVIQNVLRINPTGETYSDVTIDDILKTPGVTYDKESFQIAQGNWELKNKVWEFNYEADVTDQYTIDFTADSFSIHFGDIGNKEFRIMYKTNTGSEPVHGESFKNYAKMTDNQTVIEEVEVDRTYQSGSGEANGYHYTIELIKENEDGDKLSGAVFEIVRDRGNIAIGTVTTNSQGVVTIENLLKDDYTIKEIQAPDGYELLDKEIKISSEDFDENKIAIKTVVNKKKDEPTESTESETESTESETESTESETESTESDTESTESETESTESETESTESETESTESETESTESETESTESETESTESETESTESETESTESETESTESETESTESETESTESTESETESTESETETETESTESETESTESESETETESTESETESTESETESTESETNGSSTGLQSTESNSKNTNNHHNKAGGLLPQTGEQSSHVLITIGSTLLIGLLYIGIKRYK